MSKTSSYAINPDGDPSEIVRYCDWLMGKEGDPNHGFCATWVAANYGTSPRPALGSGQPARWPSFAAIQTHMQWAGPNPDEATPAPAYTMSSLGTLFGPKQLATSVAMFRDL